MLVETLVLEGHDPRAWGQMHGETWREKIAGLYDIRLALTLERTDLGTEQDVLRLARRHLPLLDAFDADLGQELRGIADGADIAVEKLVIVNHYTDFRDLSRAALDDDTDPGGCSAIYAPLAEGPTLAQTWDMHGSATEYVTLLLVPRPDGAHTLLFTLTGCLGMTGLTSWGLGMTINNLNSLDAKVGVLWPALVRRTLQAPSAREARDVILNAPLGSGHHYIVADERDVFGIETSGQMKKVIQQGADGVHLHTNHCIDDELKPTARILSSSTSLARYDELLAMVEAGLPRDARGLYRALDQVSTPRTPTEPHRVATCGALAMDLATRTCVVGRGRPAAAQPLVVAL